MKKILSDETQVQTDGNMVQQSEEVSGETTQESSGFLIGMLYHVRWYHLCKS
ncbi:hypothetical protein ACP6PL_07340 [Dapis sp. BLCC M126]|uniref:hypothetical protein n=1 Tax=Dapis sp. BLCC M126 TaxID=3400189 RepID=UPI003CEBDD53